jgi:hypothetical protein
MLQGRPASGEAGKYIAWTPARKGMRAVVIERNYIGGSYPNIAVINPRKNFHSIRVDLAFQPIHGLFWDEGHLQWSLILPYGFLLLC